MINLSHSKMSFFQVWKYEDHMEHCELNHPLHGDLISKTDITLIFPAANFKINRSDWGGKGGE